MNRQDPWVSQTGARRVVVEGRLIPAGGVCTVKAAALIGQAVKDGLR